MSNVHVLLKVSAPVSVPVWSGTQPLAKGNAPFRCRRRTWSSPCFGCGEGQKSWVELRTGEHREPIIQSNPCPSGPHLSSRPGAELVFNDEKWGKLLPVYGWNGGTWTSTLSPLIHSTVFSSNEPVCRLCWRDMKRSSLSFSFMLGKWCFPLICPEMKRRRMSRCWCEQRCLWSPQLSILRRSHRKALQTVVRQSSLHWQPWSCGDDHNGFGFHWDWVQVLGGSFCSTMVTVCYSASSSTEATLLTTAAYLQFSSILQILYE